MHHVQPGRRITVFLYIAEPLLQMGARAALEQVVDIDVLEGDLSGIPGAVEVIVADETGAHLLAKDTKCLRGQNQFRARILVITKLAREHAVRQALHCGIHGFVLTSSPVSDFLMAVRTLSRGEIYLCPPVAQQLSCVAGRVVLTGREDDVLRLLARGLCNKSIARQLEIAVGTVKTHVKAIMSKLNASSRTEAASIATSVGLIDVPDKAAPLSRLVPDSHPAWRSPPLH